MTESLIARTGDKAAALSVRKDDLYETPPEAIAALMAAEKLPEVIWEPACGPGAIVRVLRGAGHMVYATDLVDYDSPDQDEAGWDFLMEHQLPLGVQGIVMNPPFKNATEFAEKALALCPRVYMLGRTNFLESQKRAAVLDGGDLARVLIFRNRLPMMHRAGWNGKKSGNSMSFAWFVWERGWNKPAELHRITWRKSKGGVIS